MEGLEEKDHVVTTLESLESFAAKLEAFTAGLSDHERLVAKKTLLLAMSPFERLRWRRLSDVLDPEEAALVGSLTDPPTEC